MCVVPKKKQSTDNHTVERYIIKTGLSHQYQNKSYQETRSAIFGKELLPTIDPLFLNSGKKEELCRGHAIAASRKSALFTKDQKDFLTEKFMLGVGILKHKKKKAQEVVKEMHQKFKRSEWLSETQVQQFFARLAAKQRSQVWCQQFWNFESIKIKKFNF